MPSVIRIPIPEDTSEDALQDYFRPLVEDNHEGRPGKLRPALDLDLDDDRATVYLISLESVEVVGDTVHVSFSLEFSAYHGCRDMNYQDSDWRDIKGTRDGSDWVFPVYVSPAPLAPNEEL